MGKVTAEAALKRLARFNGEQGSCWDAPSNLERLNEVRELIYELGDYEGTMEYGCIEIVDCAVLYLPYHLESIRRAWISNKPVITRGAHYQSLDRVGMQDCCTCSTDSRRAVQLGGVRSPVLAKPAAPFSILLASEDDSEEEEIVITYIDRAGDNRKVSVVPSFTPTEVAREVQTVVGVVKPVTKGKITLFYENGDGAGLLASYQAEGVNPQYAQLRIVNFTKGDCDLDLVVLAKKAFRPIVDMDELVDIESIQALRFGYQAISAQEGNRDQEYVTKVGLMEQQLAEVDQNISMTSGTNDGQPAYGTAIHPEYDCGGRL